MTGFITGLILGTGTVVLLVYLLLRFFFFRILFLENESPFPFIDTCDALRVEAEKNNWRVPMVHDLQETMLKWGKQIGQIRIYEFCKPESAYEILSLDAEKLISSLMPYRIAVFERKNGKTYVSLMNLKPITFFAGGKVRRIMKRTADEIDIIIRKALCK